MAQSPTKTLLLDVTNDKERKFRVNVTSITINVAIRHMSLLCFTYRKNDKGVFVYDSLDIPCEATQDEILEAKKLADEFAKEMNT